MQISKRSKSAAIGLISSLLLATSILPAHAEEPVRGGVLTIADWPAPSILTSAATTAGPEAFVSPKIFDGLLTYDFDMTPRPQLAESWEVSPDGLQIKFNLRKNVKWHDGKNFTSEDVAFSVMSVWKQLHGRGRSTFANVTRVDTPDANTAILVLDRAAPAIMKALASMESQVVAKHIYGQGDILTNPANTKPIGTGPFKVVSFTRGDSLVLERNPDYWDAGKPYLDGIVIRFMPDAATRVAALESGEAQLLTLSHFPLTDIDRLKESGEYVVETKGFEFINTLEFMEFNLDDPILKNLSVRKAIAHAVDRSWISENIWFGYAKPATGPVHSSLSNYYTTEGVPTYPFDIKLANKLLDEAGYKPDGNGIRFKLTIDPIPFGDEFFKSAEFIKQSLRKIGIDVQVRSQDFATFVKRIYTDRDFQLTSTSANSGPDPTIGVQRLYWSKNFKPGVAFSNGTHYANADVDKALESAATEIDEVKRKAYFAAFQKQVMTDLPTLPVTSVLRVTIAQKKLKNFTIGATGTHSNFASAYFSAK